MSRAREERPERGRSRGGGRHRAPDAERLPVWARPEPASRRAPRTREDIAAAAMAVADAEGVDAVSMRRVARELGVGAMTLYHYLESKDDLLELMADAVVGEFLVPDDELPSGWREGLAAIARATRAAFERHPWALQGMRHPSGGPNGMRHFEQSLAAVASMPVPLFDRIELLTSVDDFVVGFVVREESLRQRARAGDAAVGETARHALAAYIEAQLQTGDYPNIQALMRDHSAEELAGIATTGERFERGLARLLDGIAADLRRRRRAAAGR
jgi:AcrR family transcriptional regulator